jgi:hypothetical protein
MNSEASQMILMECKEKWHVFLMIFKGFQRELNKGFLQWFSKDFQGKTRNPEAFQVISIKC